MENLIYSNIFRCPECTRVFVPDDDVIYGTPVCPVHNITMSRQTWKNEYLILEKDYENLEREWEEHIC